MPTDLGQDIVRVGVAGCGLMGSGIAEVCLRDGLDVMVYEPSAADVSAGRARIEASLQKALDRGKLAAEEHERMIAGIRMTSDLDDLADRDLTIEAVTDSEAVKVDLFGRLDKIVERPDAVLASNTSSIPIMKIAMATSRMVIRSQDRTGFVVNSLLVPYIIAAVRMFESGFASAEDIDTGMVLGCAHPMGPVRLADLNPTLAPPPLLLRMVGAGLLGRKTNRGFHTYGVGQ